ncbi:methyltransferase domain-containing protein [Nocardioides panacis]|uniref:Methyltransferase domain-containing protein n=1 Tax=Nocardioides panacis TaxID=2849501 RepID=A0A975SWP6_9ACTN|nr:methyltransferase domain-containing protein [Nocardioides panacis]QWZ07303.1 methyltransferase domain-containing protein [Nocardioides panacis]
MATYSLGSSDPEIARLDAQAEFLRAPTRVLLEASGIGPGMRVLDLGTGLGHVAAAVAELVGPHGEVVGLDVDPRMLEVARTRTEHLPQVRFVEGDVARWREDRSFDAVVGRLILFHLPDPVGVLRHHQQALRPGGRVVVLDYDIGGLRSEPGDPLTDRMAALILAAFRAAGADPTIGSRLEPLLAEAGVEDVEGFAIARYLASDDPVGPAMLSGVVRSLAPVMVAHGLATEAELGLDTLATRAAASLRSTGSVLVPPTLAGAWGRAGLSRR